jgi:hypothetical protein
MKPKAPRWLTEAFRDGVDERDASAWRKVTNDRAYWSAHPLCFLAQHDPLQRPCSGRLERMHFVNRQRVENALAMVLPITSYRTVSTQGLFADEIARDLILLAAWDSRNGGIACESHHRRLDSHATPELIVPHDALPDHVIEFGRDYGLESELERRYPVSSEREAAA